MSNLARAEAGIREGKPAAAARAGALAAAMLMAGLMAGCSSVSDANKPDAMYGGAPAQATSDAVFPDLRSVPQQRPEVATPAERQDIAAGLATDRAEAAQADRDLRSGTPVSNSAVSRPSPVGPLQDLPPELDKQSSYHDAPVIPMPESRGGHRDFTKVLPERLLQTAAVSTPAPEVVTEDGGATAARSEEPAVDTGPEITPAPTRKVDVKPTVGQP